MIRLTFWLALVDYFHNERTARFSEQNSQPRGGHHRGTSRLRGMVRRVGIRTESRLGGGGFGC